MIKNGKMINCACGCGKKKYEDLKYQLGRLGS